MQATSVAVSLRVQQVIYVEKTPFDSGPPTLGLTILPTPLPKWSLAREYDIDVLLVAEHSICCLASWEFLHLGG